jgi:multicomponent Na+:H+ antiporter subunit G
VNVTDIIVAVLAVIGTTFLIVSSIGVVRLPDTLTRMHANGKAATLGVGCLLISSGAWFGARDLVASVITLLLFFTTAPIGATLLSRASYRASRAAGRHRYRLSHDDLAEHYESAEARGRGSA